MTGKGLIVIVGVSVTSGRVVVLGAAVEVIVSDWRLVLFSIGVIVVVMETVGETVVVCCGPTER